MDTTPENREVVQDIIPEEVLLSVILDMYYCLDKVWSVLQPDLEESSVIQVRPGRFPK